MRLPLFVVAGCELLLRITFVDERSPPSQPMITCRHRRRIVAPLISHHSVVVYDAPTRRTAVRRLSWDLNGHFYVWVYVWCGRLNGDDIEHGRNVWRNRWYTRFICILHRRCCAGGFTYSISYTIETCACEMPMVMMIVLAGCSSWCWFLQESWDICIYTVFVHTKAYIKLCFAS